MKIIQKIEPTKPKINKRKRVAAYARVSVDKGRTMHSLSAQVSYYSKLIQKNPEWEYVGVYSDGGISGTSTESRTEFKRLIKDCEDGKVDIILTKSISRFARNTVDLLETVRKLRAINVEVRFEKEKINSLSGDGELMLSILASFAQEESRSISNNIKWSIQKRFKEGKHNGRFHIYGYRWEGQDLVIEPHEAEMVRLMYANYMNGLSAEYTARQLTKMGVMAMKGGPFKATSVRQILKNITYTGNLLLQKEYTSDPITGKSKLNKGELPQYFVENHHEAIIPMKEWQAVQEERERRKKLGAQANKAINTSCFTSKIKCGNCGMSFRRSGKKQPKGKPTYYIWTCRNKSEHGVKACNARNIPEKLLKKACAEVLGLDEFDEQVFLDKIEQVTALDGDILRFKFKNGKEADHQWTGNLRKDYWTPEVRRAWSERNKRKESSIFNGRFTEFTGFVVCDRCGANYRRQSVTYADGTVGRKWHCSGFAEDCKPGQKRNSIDEDALKSMVAEVLGIPSFDEPTMDEHLERISVIDTEVTFHFKDGHTEVRTYELPKKKGYTQSDEVKAKQSKARKKWWEEKKRDQESNNDTSNDNQVQSNTD
ncbi:recombinase family protein [Enterococcus faecalis]|nr:recombinase family protein [Enterococcus faecalis]